MIGRLLDRFRHRHLRRLYPLAFHYRFTDASATALALHIGRATRNRAGLG